ncbi:PRC-barrel domain-containing protein [Legionella sp. WA2022007384]
MNNFNIVKSADVIGNEVKSTQLEVLGQIEEIVLDKFSGEARYVVLSFKSLGEKYFALPWKSINFNEKEECFILNIEKSTLKNAQGFDKNKWPDMATWHTTIDSVYDYTNET